MNWKTILPAAALFAVLIPTAALSKNHHILDGLNPASSLQTGTPSLLGAGSSLLGGHGGGLTGAASPVVNGLTNNLTNHSMFNNNSGLLNNGLLSGSGLLHHKKRSWFSRLLSSLGLGKFQNGRFNTNGSILGNNNGGIFGNNSANIFGHSGAGGLRGFLGRI